MTEASEQHFVAFVDAAASVDHALREARDAARERGRPVGLDLVVSSEDAERAVEAAEVPAEAAAATAGVPAAGEGLPGRRRVETSRGVRQRESAPTGSAGVGADRVSGPTS